MILFLEVVMSDGEGSSEIFRVWVSTPTAAPHLATNNVLVLSI